MSFLVIIFKIYHILGRKSTFLKNFLKNNIIKKSIHNFKKYSNKLDFHSLNKKHI